MRSYIEFQKIKYDEYIEKLTKNNEKTDSQKVMSNARKKIKKYEKRKACVSVVFRGNHCSLLCEMFVGYTIEGKDHPFCNLSRTREFLKDSKYGFLRTDFCKKKWEGKNER